MAFNGSGTFNRTNGDNTGSALWQQDETDGDNIESSRHDAHDQDLADGLTNCICRDGQSTVSANIPFNSKRITGLGAATARTDGIQAAQVQDGSPIWGGTSGGTANAHTITLTPAITAYAAGQTFRFIPGAANTGATTIDINSVGAKNIFRSGAALLGGELLTSEVAEIVYDGTQFQLISPLRPAYCSVTVTSDSDASASQFSPFDEDNHSSFSSANNVTAVGITFDSSDGTFNVTNAGIYRIQVQMIAQNTNAGSNLATTRIKVNNSIKLTTQWDMEGSASTMDRQNTTNEAIVAVNAGEDVEATIWGASTIKTLSGTTMNIDRIA